MGMITKSKTGRDKTLEEDSFASFFYFSSSSYVDWNYRKRALLLLLLLAAVTGQLPTPHQCLQMS
jgi:hypothetical protein